jgi:hypothetical protein
MIEGIELPPIISVILSVEEIYYTKCCVIFKNFGANLFKHKN